MEWLHRRNVPISVGYVNRQHHICFSALRRQVRTYCQLYLSTTTLYLYGYMAIAYQFIELKEILPDSR